MVNRRGAETTALRPIEAIRTSFGCASKLTFGHRINDGLVDPVPELQITNIGDSG